MINSQFVSSPLAPPNVGIQMPATIYAIYYTGNGNIRGSIITQWKWKRACKTVISNKRWAHVTGSVDLELLISTAHSRAVLSGTRLRLNRLREFRYGMARVQSHATKIKTVLVLNTKECKLRFKNRDDIHNNIKQSV